MVIAGAGSGKTRVLTYRLAFILSQGLADPQELLALTFTNKAAKEMKERIFRLIGAQGKSIVMGTFHSIFSRILRIEAEKIGYPRNYTIYDSADSLSQVKAILKEQKMDPKVYKPGVIRNAISSAKTKMVSPKEYKDFASDDFNLKAAAVFEQYEKRLFKSGAMDFDDLLLKPILLFQSHPDILEKYQHRFRYIMVDEYQDTNTAQYLLTNMLAKLHQNICVVGDDAQSIYGFRGADIQNILNLKKDYPDLKTFKLEQNYRSTQNIVNAANGVISLNRDQIEKRVFTENEEGELIHVVQAGSEQDEAKLVSNTIREQKQLYSFFNKEFAILYRTNAQSRAMEDELRRGGIHYKVFGGLSFYQRKEIKDVVAYMRLATNMQDEQALMRIINYPTRGIGKTTLERIIVTAEANNLTPWEVIDRIDETGFNSGTKRKIREFVTMIKSFRATAGKQDAYETANYIAKNSGILKMLHAENTVEGLSRWENVQELLNASQAFTEDPDIDDVSLENQDENVENDDYVTLMTIHSAKGLEFKSVFLVGMEENLFPSSMALETRADLEEERRLFYVAVTRAMKRITLSHARSRYRYGEIQFNEPSRFLDEIDSRYIKKSAASIRRPVATRPTTTTRKAQPQRKLRPLAKATARPVAEAFDAADPSQIKEGIHVYHQKFGNGQVLVVEGQGHQRKATVHFGQKGKRVLLLKYARLKLL
ncbi:UNVERIFIED_CONTAM: hypothetical protein GTU68_012036 [Idotea baltica]|nr:hypothetical protein [Idotea baltica]